MSWWCPRSLCVTAVLLVACVDGTDPSTRTAPGSPIDSGLEPPDPVDTGAPSTTPTSDLTWYPADQTHSPMTPAVRTRMQQVLAMQQGANTNVFMKAGDSITYSNAYLHCFAGSIVDLGDQPHLQETLDVFLSGIAEDTTPFDRWSHAVLGGKTASWVMTGNPSPLQEEIDAISPAFAVVMFGTNDAGYFAPDTGRMLRWYGEEMIGLTETLVDQGIVPLLMTVPPSTSSTLGPLVDLVNGVVRGIAQGHQVPLIDYQRVMATAPSMGLSSDGVHPNAAVGGSCKLTSDGLRYGYNIRNLVTLEALDRVRESLAGTLTEPAVPLPAGDGSLTSPIEISDFPFTWMSDTSTALSDQFDTYEACGDQDESGPEEIFSVQIDQTTALRIAVIDSMGVDVDVHLLSEDLACLDRDDTLLEGTLSPGQYHIVVDTYVSSAGELGGPYVLVVVPCEEDDEACASPWPSP